MKCYPADRTLRQITGQRPRCQCCNDELVPRTTTAWFRGILTTPPVLQFLTDDQMWMESGLQRLKDLNYMPDRVFRIVHSEGNIHETTMRYWTGFYKGVGRGNDGEKLFCSNHCAVRFASAAHREGTRAIHR